VFPLFLFYSYNQWVTARFQPGDEKATSFHDLLKAIEGKVSQVKEIEDVWFIGDAAKATVMSLGFGYLHFGGNKIMDREFGVKLDSCLSFVDTSEYFL